MAWIKITSIKEENRTSKAGKAYECVVVRGMKKGYQGAPDEEWEKSLMPWNDQAWIDKFRAIGVGNTADVKSEKQGQFWRITSVTQQGGGSGGGGGGSSTPPKKEQSVPPQQQNQQQSMGNVPVIVAAPVSNDDRWMSCLKLAGQTLMKWMDQSENFKALVKRTVTPELYRQMLIDMANSFYTATPSGGLEMADTSGAVPPPEEGKAEKGKPSPQIQDDIPF